MEIDRQAHKCMFIIRPGKSTSFSGLVSMVEHGFTAINGLHTAEVTGSNPVTPTAQRPRITFYGVLGFFRKCTVGANGIIGRTPPFL